MERELTEDTIDVGLIPTQPRDQTTSIASSAFTGGFLTTSTTSEVPNVYDTLLRAVSLVFWHFIRLVPCIIKCVTESQMISDLK